MIDYIKLKDLAIGEDIKNLLPFRMEVEEDTGLICNKPHRVKLRKTLLFSIYPESNLKVNMQGSIHKYANEGLHNYDRFSLSRFRESVEELSPYVSQEDQVHVLEFGLNIKTPFNPQVFIRSLIAQKKKRFNLTDKPGMSYSWVDHTQYKLKVYSKGLQFNQGHILRLELRYNKMDNLFNNGLKWGDLTDPNTWKYLCSELTKTFEEIVYFDPSIELSEVHLQRDRIILKEGNNPLYWEQNKDTNLSRKRKQFQKAIRKYGTTFTTLTELIEEEISLLINTQGSQKVMSSDHFIEIKNRTSLSDSYQNMISSDPLLYGQNRSLTKSTSSTSQPEDYSQPNDTGRRFCLVTGMDITMQKPDSKFLGFVGLRWLLNTDPPQFHEIKKQRLSARWEEDPLDIQMREMAHSIRNEFFNPRNNTKRSIDKILEDPVLFDPVPFIRSYRLNLAGIGIENNNKKQ